MRKLLYNHTFFDDKKIVEQIYNLYIIVSNTKGLESEVYDVLTYSLDFYKSNLYFPSPDLIKVEYPTFEFIEDEFENINKFKVFLDDKQAIFRDKLRKDLVIQYLEQRDHEERQELLQRITKLEKEISFNDDDISEISDMNIDELYEYRKTVGEGPITNIEDIDNIIGGITLGKIFVLFGPPGCFKTTAAINMAYLGVVDYEKDNNTIFITLEIPKDELLYKFIVRHAYREKWNVNIKRILKGMLNEKEEELLKYFKTSFQDSKKHKLFLMDASDLNFRSMTSFINRLSDLIVSKNVKTVYIDYIQAFKAHKIKGYKDLYEFLNDLVTNLRILGVIYNVRFILLAQPNRDGIKKSKKTGGRFSLYDLAEVNSLERDAYYIMSLYADQEMKDARQILYQLIKHRDGEVIEDPKYTAILPEYFIVGKNDDVSIDSIINFGDNTIDLSSKNIDNIEFDFFD